MKLYYNLKYLVQVVSNEIINYFSPSLNSPTVRQRYFDEVIVKYDLDSKSRKHLKYDYLKENNIGDVDFLKNKYKYNELFMFNILSLEPEKIENKISKINVK